MQLSKALRLEPGLTVAFVGAGGKTSSIRRIVGEHSADRPSPILVTTTTRLGLEQRDLADLHLADPSKDEHAALPEMLEEHHSVLVTGAEEGDKWPSPSAGVLDALHQTARDAGALLLIEADGARGRSLKVPGDHEPVIPDFTGLVVPIAGLDALGQTIESNVVHRSQLVADLLGLDRDSEIGTSEIAELIASQRGGLKNVPAQAAVRALLTHASEDRLGAAHEISAALLANVRLNSVSFVDFEGEDPVEETHARIAGVVLAAGGSSRLGEPKQLIKWRGRALVAHAVRAAQVGGLAPVIVVAGREAESVRQVLEGESVDVIENADWEAGQSSSVRVGLDAAAEGTEGIVFLLADMPFVGPDLVASLITRHRQTLAPLVATWAGGRRANPVLFDRKTYSDLEALEGDRGGRTIFSMFEREYVHWDDSILLDVDTPRDLERLRELEWGPPDSRM